MLRYGNEDSEDKAALVSPNDVLDIEISPIITAKTTSWLNGFECKRRKSKHPSHKSVTKQRKSRKLKSTTSITKQHPGEMNRGDPFLPSVMTDENPIAEYSTMKTVAKKPTDCKCKGMGYNCSPSAMLPEEMRQQWGCGMLGKATPSHAGGCPSSESAILTRTIAPCVISSDIASLPKTAFCGNNCSLSISPKPGPVGRSQTICWECKTYPCLCFTTAPKIETIENDERKKQKPMNRGGFFKSKGSKTRLLINATSNSSKGKRITCFNKENNIISTSNFTKDNASPFSSMSEEGSYYYDNKYNPTVKNSNKSRSDHYRDIIYMTSGNDYMTTSRVLPEENSFTPVSRYRNRFRANHRPPTSISPSTIASANGPFGDARMFDPAHQRLPVSSKQMYMADPQVCYCERCKRRVQLLSKMEALGFPSSSTHPKPSPYSLAPQQRYNPPSMQFPSHSSNRYVPYSPYSSYTYPNMSDTGSFTSPEVSSPVDEDLMMRNKVDSNTFRPLLSQSTASDAFAYLDTDQMLDSPYSNSEAIVDDLMDLSVKDTVDFFLGLKSPLADTLPLSCESLEPATQNESFDCSLSNAEYSFESTSSLSTGLQEESIDEPQPLQHFPPPTQSFSSSGRDYLNPTPMSQIYSNLISDLEDELKCAIENIPVE